MAIKYRIAERQNPLTKTLQYYAQVMPVEPLTLEDIAEGIEKTSTVSSADIKAVLDALQFEVIRALRAGTPSAWATSGASAPRSPAARPSRLRLSRRPTSRACAYASPPPRAWRASSSSTASASASSPTRGTPRRTREDCSERISRPADRNSYRPDRNFCQPDRISSMNTMYVSHTI